MNKLKQSTKQNQRKVLSQQTRQAISILQLNSFDLHKEIENLTEIAKVTFVSRQFIALPKNKNSAKSRMYILQKII